MSIARHKRLSAIAVIAATSALGALVAVQGWRERTPGSDVLPYIDGAHALLSSGKLPEYGVVTSLSSYAPPGFAWTMLPGVWLFEDPRLFDVPGTVLLQLGTLIGIFLLARACAGVRTALLAVVLYGVSGPGLMFAGTLGAGSLGPRGHPLFVVWMAYWLCQWVSQKRARYLAAALLTWSVGMYVFMEIAPAILVVPVVWFRYRPPTSGRLLVATCAVVAAIWYPYLRFEAARGFMDIRSQLLVTTLAPENEPSLMCDAPALHERTGSPAPAALQPASASPAIRFAIQAGSRVLAITRGLAGNFEGLIPGAALLLLAFALGGLLVLSMSGEGGPYIWTNQSWPTAAAIGLLALAAVANVPVLARLLGSGVPLGSFARDSIRLLQQIAGLVGIALLARRPLAAGLRVLARRRGPTAGDPRVLVLSLVVPWIVMLLVAEPGRQDRLVGLWPLQAIAIAAFIARLSEPRQGSPGVLGRALPLAAIGVVLASPLLLQRIESWRRDGWPGADSVDVRLANRLAQRLRSEGHTHAAIGYQFFLEAPPEPPWKAVNTRWKVGAETDAFLEYRYGIVNSNQCGAGLSAHDEYRVVDTDADASAGLYYFEVPPSHRLRLVDRVDRYDVYERDRFR